MFFVFQDTTEEKPDEERYWYTIKIDHKNVENFITFLKSSTVLFKNTDLFENLTAKNRSVNDKKYFYKCVKN
jgi:hypothetical protein